MRLYHNVDVELSYQNSGSSWTGILRGRTEDIKDVFNGLFNYCASHGELTFIDHCETVATFWTDKRAMRRFFFNQYFTPRQTGAQSDEFVIVREKDKQFRLRIQCARFNGNGRIARQGIRYARERLKALSKCHEFFRDFSVKVNNETYASGTISAERPDNDMKDLILANAFKEKETLPHKVVDNE